MILSIIIVIPFHICLYFVQLILFKVDKCRLWKFLWKVPKLLANTLFRILTFGFYIRSFIEMSMFIMIYTIYEALIFNTEDILHIISLAFAISMILFYIILIAIILLLIFSSYKIDESSHNKLEEFFIGLKSFKKTRIHIQ